MTTTLEREFGQSTLESIHRRRAVRTYTTEPLSSDTIHILLDAAIQAPTAMHEEPWAFVVIQDARQLKRYSDMAKEMIVHEGIVGYDRLKDPAYNIFHDAGTLIVICGKPMGPFVSADCWLAAENLMLAATAIGLGTCPIGFAVGVLNDPTVKAELGIPAGITAIAPILVGVPRGSTPPVPRKLPDILCWLR